MLRALALAALLLPAAAAASDSGIGLGFAEVETGVLRDGAAGRAFGRLTGDFRITGVHGLQFDLAVEDWSSGLVGRIDAHLYLAPQAGRKYGLFLSLADADGREATAALAGVAGILELAPGTVLSGHAALGYARPRAIDFVAVSAGIGHALSDDVSVFAEVGLAEFDEEALRATVRQARAGVVWEPQGRPFAATFAVARDDISGRDGRPGETRAEFGLSFRFGATGGARRPVADRAFRAPQPWAPLVGAGLF